MKTPRTLVILMLWIGLGCAVTAQTRWSIQDDGGIAWNVTRGEAHQDHVEMSGQKVSVIVTYGVDKAGLFTIKQHVAFPMLRFKPNQTRDHLALDFSEDASPRIFLNNAIPRNNFTTRVRFKGILRAEGTMGRNNEISWTRTIFPSPDKPAVIEKTVFVNRGGARTLFWKWRKTNGRFGPIPSAESTARMRLQRGFSMPVNAC